MDPQCFSTDRPAARCRNRSSTRSAAISASATPITAAVFVTSRQSDALIDAAHQALADFFGTADAGTVAFGPNMTTLTLALSRALARELAAWRRDRRDAARPRRQRHALGARGPRCRRQPTARQRPPRRLHARSGRSEIEAFAAHPAGGRGLRVERGRHDQSDRRNCPADPRRRRGAICRRGSCSAAFAVRRDRLGLRLPGGLGLQVLWAAFGRAVGKARAARAIAGLQASAGAGRSARQVDDRAPRATRQSPARRPRSTIWPLWAGGSNRRPSAAARLLPRPMRRSAGTSGVWRKHCCPGWLN